MDEYLFIGGSRENHWIDLSPKSLNDELMRELHDYRPIIINFGTLKLDLRFRDRVFAPPVNLTARDTALKIYRDIIERIFELRGTPFGIEKASIVADFLCDKRHRREAMLLRRWHEGRIGARIGL